MGLYPVTEEERLFEDQFNRRFTVFAPLQRCVWPALAPRTLGATTGGAPDPVGTYNLLTGDGNNLLTSDGNNLVHGDAIV